MSYTENLWLFFILVLGIIAVPGMDMLITLSHALSPRKNSGYAAIAGIVAGGVLHSVYAALGVGVILTLYPAGQTLLLYAGAAYIFWIGLQLVRSDNAIGGADAASGAAKPYRAAFRDGFVTCMTNPKAYLFMLAIYPQFLKPDYGPLVPQALVMALMIASTQIVIYGSIARGAGVARHWLDANPSAQMIATRAIGWLMIAIAAMTVWSGI